jgi:alkylated DNA nucleotide flippase Atl1
MSKRKSWREKLADDKDLPKVVRLTGKAQAKWGTGTIAIPAPREVDAIMKRVPRGKLITINEIRELVAKKHGATVGCPITTGIFAWISAHAAEEAAADGETDITPFWRTLKSGGELNPKYPGGVTRLRERLEAEGHRVVSKGKRFLVADYQDHLVTVPATQVRRTAAAMARS